MRKHRASSLGLFLASVLATSGGLVRHAKAADCLGPRPVEIDVGKIGTLPLDAPLDSLRRICPNVRDTTASGDESADTAIVISMPDLRVVGRIATVADGDGYHRISLSSTTRVREWEVSGPAGVLPNGVPLTATWRQVARAYGNLRALGLNGTVYVTVCSRPRLRIFMNLPSPYTPINGQNATTVDSALADVHIASVMVPRKGAKPAVPDSTLLRTMGCPGI